MWTVLWYCTSCDYLPYPVIMKWLPAENWHKRPMQSLPSTSSSTVLFWILPLAQSPKNKMISWWQSTILCRGVKISTSGFLSRRAGHTGLWIENVSQRVFIYTSLTSICKLFFQLVLIIRNFSFEVLFSCFYIAFFLTFKCVPSEY